MTTLQRALRGVALPVWVMLALAAQRAAAATLTLAPGQGLDAALAQAADGDTIEIGAGSCRGEVGVITQRRLTLRGVGERPVFRADGRSAEGKAILVVRSAHENSAIRVENLEFRGARVADRNGAGIRFERGRLQVVRCAFVDNENGILTAGHADAELSISDSDLSQAPPATPLPHLLDAGNIASQSAGTSNPTVVSYGAEGYDDRAQGLVFSDNTVINAATRPATFLRVREAVRPFEQKRLNNRFFGPGDAGGATAADGNTTAPLGALGEARP
jgi:hypothetical protein